MATKIEVLRGETPVEGVNWEFGPSFGEPQSATAFQQPRTFRFSFGLRF